MCNDIIICPRCGTDHVKVKKGFFGITFLKKLPNTSKDNLAATPSSNAPRPTSRKAWEIILSLRRTKTPLPAWPCMFTPNRTKANWPVSTSIRCTKTRASGGSSSSSWRTRRRNSTSTNCSRSRRKPSPIFNPKAASAKARRKTCRRRAGKNTIRAGGTRRCW